jgi:hypothetical protein
VDASPRVFYRPFDIGSPINHNDVAFNGNSRTGKPHTHAREYAVD